MSKQNNNFSQRNTLDVNSEKKHKTDLGLSVPENYFQQSKRTILEQTVEESKKISLFPFSSGVYKWSAVAAIALVFTIVVGSYFEKNEVLESDILIASLMAEEDEVEAIIDGFVQDELLTEEVFLE
ncbi:hypothetical protein [Tenacibaculum sp. SG-28]|uniref:hypothetical protein n=1 Tax=Tenacibaculum sp. SG-28 TaxID=754426 RepID=UPI000CF3E15A|nr:hypothetical protein [Tenacibaculum sp. SG-28]PQJ21608.1 hypothetical protein BSU00_05735 [Tenacibaculum sp. SG-28]